MNFFSAVVAKTSQLKESDDEESDEEDEDDYFEKLEIKKKKNV